MYSVPTNRPVVLWLSACHDRVAQLPTGRLITVDHSSPEEAVSGANHGSSSHPTEIPGWRTDRRGPLRRERAGLAPSLPLARLLSASRSFAPKVNSVTFTPKVAVLLLSGRHRASSRSRQDRITAALATVSAVAFLGASSFGTGFPVTEHGPRSLVGYGLLAVPLGAAGAFAIGRSCPNDRRWLWAAIACLLRPLTRLVAVFQIVKNLPTPVSACTTARTDGFLGNPIHLEALLLGGSRSCWEERAGHPCAWGAVVLLLVVGLEFTFERLAVLILVSLVELRCTPMALVAAGSVCFDCGWLRHRLP